MPIISQHQTTRSIEFLRSKEGMSKPKRSPRSILYGEAWMLADIIRQRMIHRTYDLVSPALLHHALECAEKAMSLTHNPDCDLREVGDLIAIAEAHKDWAYERVAFAGDDLFRDYLRGRLSDAEFCTLANREAHVECTCHPVTGGMCRTCKAEVEE